MKARSIAGLRRRVVLAASACLAGCAGWVDTPYVRPVEAMPDRWQHAAGPVDGQPAPASASAAAAQPSGREPAWWDAFDDARLGRLIDTALQRNADLGVAEARVRQAGLEADLAAGALRPTPSLEIQASRSRFRGRNADSSGLSAGVAVEADLWGRLANLRDARRLEAAAVGRDRIDLALEVATATASAYWRIAFLNEQLALNADGLDYAERTRGLVRSQYQAGAVSALETRQADLAVTGQQAARATLQQQRVVARHALRLLLAAPLDAASADTAADVVEDEPTRLPVGPPPNVAAGIPAEVLSRRPDLQAAEFRLRRTLAEGDAARAAYYPTLTLTGSFGTSSAALADVLANPVRTLGAGLVLPFLRINDLRLEGELASARYGEAVVVYRQTLLAALVEVENALSARRRLAEQAGSLEAQLQAARDVERLSEVRYRAGAIALQLLLDAQERRRAAENSRLANRIEQLDGHVALVRALGGDGRR